MGIRYSVRRTSGGVEAISAEFNGDNKVSGDTVVCREGSTVTFGNSVFAVGPRSSLDPTACIFLRRPAINGDAPRFSEVWDEYDGWTLG